MRRLRQVIVGGVVLFAGFAVSQVEIPVARNHATGALDIGSISVPLWSAALAQGTQALTLENMRVNFGGTVYEAKRVDISGLAGSRADIDALLSSTSTEPMAARLRRIGARSISIPELTVTTKMGGETRSETYYKIAVRDIAEGKLAEATAESLTGEIVHRGNQRMPFSAARLMVSDVDLAGITRLYEVRATRPDEPWSKLYGAVSLENLELVEPSGKSRIRFGRFSGRDLLGRPMGETQSDIAAFFADFNGRENHTDAENMRAIKMAADVLDAFRIGSIELSAIEVQMAGDAKTKDGTFKIGRVAYAAATPTMPADIRMEGLELLSPDARVTVASTSLSGFSFAATIEGMKKLEGKALAEISAADWRALIPTIGTYRQSGVAIDLPKAPMKAALKGFELTADKPLNGVPTNLRLAWTGFSLALQGDEDWARELRALGYEAIDVSFALAMNWNAETSEIAVTELNLAANDMGKVSATAVLGNVAKEAFSPDKGAAAAALLSAKAKSVTLRIEDGRDLLDRVITKAAKDQKTTPAKLRSFYAEGAVIVGVTMLGNSLSASTITKSVVNYIMDPSSFTLRATPQSPSGITMLELIATQDPKKILEKVDVSAKAE
jgi:hypothetical protein